MTHRLDNYLRTYRKRSGLSQDEVAFLLGCHSGTKVSRHERRHRQPTLENALAYAAVFRVPAAELFAGLYEKVETRTRARAKALLARIAAPGSAPTDRRRTEFLRALVDEEEVPASLR